MPNLLMQGVEMRRSSGTITFDAIHELHDPVSQSVACGLENEAESLEPRKRKLEFTIFAHFATVQARKLNAVRDGPRMR
ncbi:unnamed protein product [Gongylonema pulchrum]|uniref:Uncharacterized protein n=1 Tax=Gongylonema pulchrum TaxID=637853 RepID=A0A183DJS7_9BILA|nr:unnamed protein product [Gongylonema pulchrum]